MRREQHGTALTSTDENSLSESEAGTGHVRDVSNMGQHQRARTKTHFLKATQARTRCERHETSPTSTDENSRPESEAGTNAT